MRCKTLKNPIENPKYPIKTLYNTPSCPALGSNCSKNGCSTGLSSEGRRAECRLSYKWALLKVGAVSRTRSALKRMASSASCAAKAAACNDDTARVKVRDIYDEFQMYTDAKRISSTQHAIILPVRVLINDSERCMQETCVPQGWAHRADRGRRTCAAWNGVAVAPCSAAAATCVRLAEQLANDVWWVLCLLTAKCEFCYWQDHLQAKPARR